MFKIFKNKKKKQSKLPFPGIVELTNGVTDAFNQLGNAIVFGSPEQISNLQNNTKRIKVFILYSDKTAYERQEIDKIKNQLNYIYSALINDTPCIFSYITTKNIERSIHEALISDIIIDTGSCGDIAKSIKTLANNSNKKFIDADVLQGSFLFIKQAYVIYNEHIA